MTCSFFDWVFLQMKIPHFCKMGAGKFASSLQHYNCIFNHVKDSLTLTLTALSLTWFSNTITKTLSCLAKKLEIFRCNSGEFYFAINRLGNYFQAFNKYTLFMWKI